MKPTGRTVTTIKPLGRGSDYFGACECCGKNASEMFKRVVGREIERADGSTFIFPGAGTYGHEACLGAATT